MKAIILSSVFLAGSLFFNKASATLHTIQVGPGSSTNFIPATLTVAPGDSIKWVWGGTDVHSTTSTALGIPAGAATWDAPIDASHTSFVYVPTILGTYNYHCTPHLSFGMVATFTVAFPTAVKSVATDNEVTLGPNPSSGDLKVQVGKGASIDLLDISGRFIRHMQPTLVSPAEQRFSLYDIAVGMYLLNIKTNGAVITKKLQIAR